MNTPTIEREYERIRDDAWVEKLIAMVSEETNGTMTLVNNDMDAAMIDLGYTNPIYGIGCNVGIFDPGIVVQVYGYRAGDGPMEGTELGDITDMTDEMDPPKDAPTRAYVEHLVRLLVEADGAGHDEGFCNKTTQCAWCETHARGNCDGPEHCRNCREDDRQFRELVTYLKIDLHSDPYGEAMGMMFDVCDQITYGLKRTTPSAWMFHSPSGQRGTPVEDLPEEITEASEFALVRFGDLLRRYIARVRRAGLDY